MHCQNNDMMVDINIIFLGHGMMKVVTLPWHDESSDASMAYEWR